MSERRETGPTMAGRIILVNGTSSSGKTALTRALQGRLPDLWLEMGIDRFAYALPARVAGEPTWPLLFRYVPGDGNGRFRIETTPAGHRFVSGLHAAVAAIAGNGLNVIVDHVILERAWLEDCDRLWAGFSVVSVGVRCPLEVVLRRELARKDRTLGQAEAQFEVVHRWARYDVEVDTSVLSPDEAADRVADALDRPAIGRIRRPLALRRPASPVA